MNLNFLKGINAVKTPSVKMNADFTEAIKANLSKCSKSVELTIKNMDNMLGLRVVIANSGKPTFDSESGIEPIFLDAVLNGALGNTEALEAYDPTKYQIEKGKGFKLELLEQFLSSPLPTQARFLKIQEESTILEVTFQLGYRRKLKIYFSNNDEVAREKLKDAGFLKEEIA